MKHPIPKRARRRIAKLEAKLALAHEVTTSLQRLAQARDEKQREEDLALIAAGTIPVRALAPHIVSDGVMTSIDRDQPMMTYRGLLPAGPVRMRLTIELVGAGSKDGELLAAISDALQSAARN